MTADHPPTAERLPQFLVVGAMRSGTTSLYRYLSAHPEIFMVPKELQFFTDQFDKGSDWYRAQFEGAGTTQVLGEATADYLARRSAMNRIAEMLPNIRLVASLRNPVERAWSHYGLLTARGRETRPFEEALDAEMTILAAEGDGASGVFYLYHGLYDVQLERAYRLFDPERIHVSIFERMAVDPRRTYQSICTFVGVDPSFIPENLGERVNAFVTFRSVLLRRLAQRLPSPARRAIDRLNTRQQAPRQPLQPHLRDRLEEFFAPRIGRVERLLGYKIPEWGPAGR